MRASSSSRSRCLTIALLVAAFAGEGSVRAESGSTEELAERLQPADPELERRLVAAKVRGRDRGLVEVLSDGRGILIPIADLGRMLDIEFQTRDGAIVAFTPLGQVAVPGEMLEVVERRTYVRQRYVSEGLHSRLRFDPADYSIAIEPIWKPGASANDEHLEADVGPPDATIAGLRGILDHTRSRGESLNAGSVQMVGRLGEGVWSLTAEDSDTRPYNLREYTWYRRQRQAHYLVGRQRLQLHSALGGFDLAGFQYGWSNAPRTNQPVTYGANALFPRRGQPLESVRGTANAGHFVQLRVDGRIVGSRQVGFNGKFVFDDVALPTRRAAELELLIFEPTNLRVPIEIRRLRRSASEYLLPAQTTSHMVGIGQAGRLTEGVADAAPGATEGIGGYYQWRQGLTRRLTGEALIQHDGGNAEGWVGVIGRLAETWVGSAGIIQTSEATGYQADVEGYMPRWRVLARSLVRPGDIGFADSPEETRDHVLEVAHRFPEARLELGLVARKRRDAIRDTAFVHPTLTWQPNSRLYLDARPDFDGDTLLGLSYRPDDSTYLRYFRSETSNFEATRQLNERWSTGIGAEFEEIEPRYSSYVSRHQMTRAGAYVGRVSAIRTEDQWGYALAASGPVGPGVVARAEYQSIPRVDLFGSNQGRFSLNLVTDLAFSGGSVQPARALPYRRESGLVVGKVTIDAESQRLTGVAAGDFDLAGAKIIVDGATRATTDSHGRFTINNLPVGIYEVELDPEDLPIELSPTRLRLRAEIAAGASTRVDFPVSLQYGIAGRVTDRLGNPLANIAVELRTPDGTRIGRARTDTFGLYRIDQVPPGGYTLVALDAQRVIARRTVTVAGDFEFGVDLVLHRGERPMGESDAASE